MGDLLPAMADAFATPSPDTDARLAQLEAALSALVNAKALSGVRELVGGWNGEDRPEGPYGSRHPSRMGASIKTTCGAIYALDEAMVSARDILSNGGSNV
jgi:hypothetical protein